MTRRTQQKDAIWAAFQTANRPLSVHEVLKLASKQIKDLSIATVYRNVGKLVENGLLSAIEIPGETHRYSIATTKNSDHFKCDYCGRIYKIEACLLTTKPRLPQGFRGERHQVFFFGACSRCCKNAMH